MGGLEAGLSPLLMGSRPRILSPGGFLENALMLLFLLLEKLYCIFAFPLYFNRAGPAQQAIKNAPMFC